MKPLILVPELKDITGRVARQIKGAIVRVNVETAVRLARAGKIDRIVVLLGGKKEGHYVGVEALYYTLKIRLEGFKVTFRFLDGYKWDVPGMTLLNPGLAKETLIQACFH